MADKINDGGLEALRNLADSLLREEVIGGTSLLEAIEFVDLDIEFTPVLQHPLADEFQPWRPTEVQKWPDGRYAIVTRGDSPDFEVVPVESLKIMRARYLLHSKARQARQFAGLFERLAERGKRNG